MILKKAAIRLKFLLFSGVRLHPINSNDEVGDEEKLDFHLEPADDISWDDDNMLSDRNPSSEGDDNTDYEKEMFRTMSHAADQHTILDEYWDIVKRTFSSEVEAYIFYNKYARDKSFSVRRQINTIV